MKKQLFPKEFLSHSFEVHQFQHDKKSQRIYWVILLFLVAVLFSLPLIKVNVYTTVRGMIKPKEERFVLRANAGGQVVYSQLMPNKTVKKGDTLLRLSHPILDEKKTLLSEQIAEHKALLNDLATLTQTEP